MSSFLQKLKSGGSSIDNNAPPDECGVIVRRLEKHYVGEPVESLGLVLTEDAEVRSVTPGSPAAISNILPQFMIFEVNNEFVENSSHFAEAAGKNLNLIIKLQSVGGMSELIANILRMEELASSGDASSPIDFDELHRTTPRFNFLSVHHPLFRRYTKRLMEKRAASTLIKQRIQEAEEKQRQEIRERIQREIQAAEEEKRKQDAIQRENDVAARGEAAQPVGEFVKFFEDQSTFAQESVVVAEKANEGNTLTSTTFELASPNLEATSGASPISTTELLALVGLPTNGNQQFTPLEWGSTEVRYTILPSEEYVLTNGESVICSLKSRTGIIPLPPPGKPPKINRAARTVLLKNGNSASHLHSALKVPTLPAKRIDNIVCRDYQRGKCTRGSKCRMRHVTPPRKRSRSRTSSRHEKRRDHRSVSRGRRHRRDEGRSPEGRSRKYSRDSHRRRRY